MIPALRIWLILVLWAAIPGTMVGQIFAAAQSPESVDVVGDQARRLAGRILGEDGPKHRPPYISDAEHARTMDPVLTSGAAIWIREDRLSGGRPSRVTVQEGSVFNYNDAAFDPLQVPNLRIRTIDDHQEVPFLIRIILSLDGDIHEDSSVIITTLYSGIFRPRIEACNAWIGSRRVDPSITTDIRKGELSVVLGLPRSTLADARQGTAPVVVVIEGRLVVGRYDVIPRGAFSSWDDAGLSDELESMATLELGRDGDTVVELERIRGLVRTIVVNSADDFDRVVAIHRWVSSSLRYQEALGERSAMEALDDSSGDCSDFTALMAAFLRAAGIPCRRSVGVLYDLDNPVPHAWLEVALPLKDGRIHWVICDPTLANRVGSNKQKDEFVQIKNRVYLYSIQPFISFPGVGGRTASDLFLNWRTRDEASLAEPAAFDRLATEVIEEVDGAFVRQGAQVADSSLRLRREYATLPGSRYLLFERPVADDRSTWMRMWLENEERLTLEMENSGGLGFHSEEEQAIVERLRSVHRFANETFFDGVEAHRNLELVYQRDPHTDLLKNVRLRFGRFLIHNQSRKILRRLLREELISEQDAELLTSLLNISQGRNLYLLQEMARRVEPDR